jgi:phosphoglucomutase
MIAPGDKDTPVISHAFLNYDRDSKNRLADGIVVTPPHNPPQDGGVKWSLFNGGTAVMAATGGIETRANENLESRLDRVRGVLLAKALKASGGWFAARPLGTKNIYKIYAESFRGEDDLRRILQEAQTIASDALAATTAPECGKPRASSVLHEQTASDAKEAWRRVGNPN